MRDLTTAPRIAACAASGPSQPFLFHAGGQADGRMTEITTFSSSY
jgi:hypothetical protein